MRKAILIMAALAAASGPAIAQDATATNLSGAATVEWFVAHCDAKAMNGLYFMWATIVVNGAGQAEMDPYRQHIRDQMAQKFGSNTGAACDALAAGFSKPPTAN